MSFARDCTAWPSRWGLEAVVFMLMRIIHTSGLRRLGNILVTLAYISPSSSFNWQAVLALLSSLILDHFPESLCNQLLFLKGGQKSKFPGFLRSSLRFPNLHGYVSAKHTDKKYNSKMCQRQHVRSTSFFFFFCVCVVFFLNWDHCAFFQVTRGVTAALRGVQWLIKTPMSSLSSFVFHRKQLLNRWK